MQLPWTTSSPPVKGDYHVWSDTGWIRHGAVVCWIVNWKGLNAYSVTRPLKYLDQIWCMASFDTCWSTLKRIKLCRIYYLCYSVDREGGGGRSKCNMKFWILKQDKMHESGPAGVKVVRVFCPTSVCSCFRPLVVHMWKGDTTFSLKLALYDMAPWCRRIVDWMGLTAFNVTSPLNIWTKFCVWLSRTLGGPPAKEEGCVVSIIYSIEWIAKGGGV